MPPKGPKEGKGVLVDCQLYTGDLRVFMFSGGKGGDKPKPKDDKKGGGGKGGKEGGKKGK